MVSPAGSINKEPQFSINIDGERGKNDSEYGLSFPGQSLEGLVGNGQMIVSVKPEEFQFKYSRLVESGSVELRIGAKRFSLKNCKTDSFFIPGCVTYFLESEGAPQIGYSLASPHDKNIFFSSVRLKNLSGEKQSAELIFNFKINLPQGRLPVAEKKGLSLGETHIVFNQDFSLNGNVSNAFVSVSVPVSLSPKEKKEILCAVADQESLASAEEMILREGNSTIEKIAGHYIDSGFKMRTPDAEINRAVSFLKYLLQLGYDWPRTMVADIFRWRDVWSRDLGSGSGPGALQSGMFEAARKSLLYDLERHRREDPASCRVSEDTSQGGSAEGLGWISSCIWRDYLYTGDKDFLKKAYDILKPWTENWIARGYDNSGLIIDVTEWMDHSRFLRLPEGIRTLYSNELFYVLLDCMSKMAAVVDPASEPHYKTQAEKICASINEKFWNDSLKYYNNYIFWDLQDEKLDSIGNSCAILFGLSKERTPQILDSIRKKCWRKFGSVNIYPAMKYVGADNDHNVRVWPWWQAKEAKARFLNSDIAGGLKLLALNLDTLRHPKFPGLIEEYLYPDDGKIDDYAGHAFITGSGSTLDCIISGMLGFEVLSPASMEVRVSPNVPEEWQNWSAFFPVPEGGVDYSRNGNKISCNLTGKSVRRIELQLPRESGEGKVFLNNYEMDIPFDGSMLWVQMPQSPSEKIKWGLEKGDSGREVKSSVCRAVEFPGDEKGDDKSENKPLHSPAIFFEEGFPDADPAAVDALKKLLKNLGKKVSLIGVKDLPFLNSKKNDALIFTRFVLPFRMPDGSDPKGVIEKYIGEGGTVVLWGAETFPKGTLGEQGSLLEWVSLSPALSFHPVGGKWKFSFADSDFQKKHEDEEGYKKGFHLPGLDDSRWQEIGVNQSWEKATGKEFNGYGWYRKSVLMPKAMKGKPLILSLGKIDDNDWTYLNGRLAGNTEGWQTERLYRVEPSSPAYQAIEWGGMNVLAIQVQDTMGGGGMHEGLPEIGFLDSDKMSYQYYDEAKQRISNKPVRGGIVSWGPGKFFNDWALSLGLFGFRVEAAGVEFSKKESEWRDLPSMDMPVRNVYTDFPVKKPWRFIPYAYTTRNQKWIESGKTDRYPCVAALKNSLTGGRFFIVAPEVASHAAAIEVLKRIVR